jgi:glucose/arabinose dehydrogenase
MVPWGPVSALVATKNGKVWLFDGTNVSEDVALDISDQVRDSGEQGLLAIAVHPEDTDRLYVHYSARNGDTVVSEFSWDNGFFVDELIRLRVEQPAADHNGGMIQFGPDGGLFLGLGDGGGRADRFDNGQNRDTLLGGLVRIDVDSGESELFQYGLRNPWRFWIDGSTIFVADVGQGAFEEISVAQLTKGVNYGWPITEGLHCFRPKSGCDTTGLRLPAVEVTHDDAETCSITGGVVYGGEAIPELQRTFFFSDYCGGYLRGLRDDVVVDYTDQVGAVGAVASFGTDVDGEIYVLTSKALLKLVPVRG